MDPRADCPGSQAWGALATNVPDPPACIAQCRQRFLETMPPPAGAETALAATCAALTGVGKKVGSKRAMAGRESGQEKEEEEDKGRGDGRMWQLYCCDQALCGVYISAEGGIGQDPNVNAIINQCQGIGYPAVFDPGPPSQCQNSWVSTFNSTESGACVASASVVAASSAAAAAASSTLDSSAPDSGTIGIEALPVPTDVSSAAAVLSTPLAPGLQTTIQPSLSPDLKTVPPPPPSADLQTVQPTPSLPPSSRASAPAESVGSVASIEAVTVASADQPMITPAGAIVTPVTISILTPSPSPSPISSPSPGPGPGPSPSQPSMAPVPSSGIGSGGPPSSSGSGSAPSPVAVAPSQDSSSSAGSSSAAPGHRVGVALGAVVGALVLLAMGALVAYLIRRRRRRRRQGRGRGRSRDRDCCYPCGRRRDRARLGSNPPDTSADGDVRDRIRHPVFYASAGSLAGSPTIAPLIEPALSSVLPPPPPSSWIAPAGERSQSPHSSHQPPQPPLTPPPRLRERRLLSLTLGGGDDDSSSSSLNGSAAGAGPRVLFPASPICAPTTNKLVPRRERAPKLQGLPPPPMPHAQATTPSGNFAGGDQLQHYHHYHHRSNTPLSPIRPPRPHDGPLEIPDLVTPAVAAPAPVPIPTPPTPLAPVATSGLFFPPSPPPRRGLPSIPPPSLLSLSPPPGAPPRPWPEPQQPTEPLRDSWGSWGGPGVALTTTAAPWATASTSSRRGVSDDSGRSLARLSGLDLEQLGGGGGGY